MASRPIINLDPTFYTKRKVNKNLTSANQKIVKDTIQELIRKQQLPVTARNFIITTPRASCIYFKPEISNVLTDDSNFQESNKTYQESVGGILKHEAQDDVS
mgnify:CR=1 FL=1